MWSTVSAPLSLADFHPFCTTFLVRGLEYSPLKSTEPNRGVNRAKGGGCIASGAGGLYPRER